MLNIEIITQLLYHFVVQIRSIVCNDPARDTIAADDLVLDELDHHLLGHIGVGRGFDLLGKIVNGHKDKTVPI